MLFADTKIRVRYAETDQMGYVYYGNYATYCEVGRVELLRTLGTNYKALEESGIMLPVIDYSVQYKKPALYDDELTIRTSLKAMPKVKIIFDYEIFNASGDLINIATTTLVFVDKITGRPCSAPKWFLNKLQEKF